MAIKQITSPVNIPSRPVNSTATSTVTPGSGQPIQNPSPKVPQPPIAAPTVQKTQLGLPVGKVYDFQIQELLGLDGGTAYTQKGDTGIYINPPASMRKRKLFGGFYIPPAAGATMVQARILISLNSSVVATIPWGASWAGPGIQCSSPIHSLFTSGGAFQGFLASLLFPGTYIAPGSVNANTNADSVFAFSNVCPIGTLLYRPSIQILNAYPVAASGTFIFDYLFPMHMEIECDKIAVYIDNVINCSDIRFVIACESFA